MEFKLFCEKTSENIGLKFFGHLRDKKHSGAYIDENGKEKEFYIEFCDLSGDTHKLFVAEFFERKRNLYVGSVSFEEYNGKKSFEHYETQVSPNHRYNSEYQPINEKGEVVDGELWSFYNGKSLKWACKSFLKGGAMLNPERKPKKVW